MRHADEYVARAVWDRLRDLDLADPEDRYFFTEVARRYASTIEVDPEREAGRRLAQAVINDVEAALTRLDGDRTAGVFDGASGTDRYRRQVASLSERGDAARATLAALPRITPGEDEAALRDVLYLLRYEGTDYADSESPWSSWDLQARRDFLALLLDRVTVAKATGHGGGDRVPWTGHERIHLEWATFTPF